MMKRTTRQDSRTRTGRPRREASRQAMQRSHLQRQQDVQDNVWDGEQRFAWTPETEQHMFASGQRDPVSGVTVYRCADNQGFYPRKKDLSRYKRAHPEIPPDDFDYISIDHHTPYRTYIQSTCGDGRPTKDEAKAAYNDIDNLILLRQRKNSSKSDH